ncbi:hypothetical protein CALVIDRAFT_84614 [Calocera viscosa TUFC12733]|uniref:Uncharacterized protein n=1 Tax=Calocera viscosa (strain TUFC12733) TaxID=1330018 RepID=A0A167N499_CALVF|nr:hypothetical protein CALVIDRAFT_84614 [Calocera viscosa TUFC12733]
MICLRCMYQIPGQWSYLACQGANFDEAKYRSLSAHIRENSTYPKPLASLAAALSLLCGKARLPSLIPPSPHSHTFCPRPSSRSKPSARNPTLHIRTSGSDMHDMHIIIPVPRLRRASPERDWARSGWQDEQPRGRGRQKTVQSVLLWLSQIGPLPTVCSRTTTRLASNYCPSLDSHVINLEKYHQETAPQSRSHRRTSPTLTVAPAPQNTQLYSPA